MAAAARSGGSQGRDRHALDQADPLRDTTRLNRLFAILDDAVPLPVVLDRVVLALSELFAADIVALLTLDDDTLKPIASIGIPEDDATRALARAGYAARALDAAGPVIVAHPAGEGSLDPVLRELDVQHSAWLALPETVPPGVIVLARCSGVAFSPSDGNLLAAMARWIALAIQRARDREERRRVDELRRQAEKTESLARMAAAIAHLYNNRLTAVGAYIGLARQDLRLGDDPTAELAAAADAVEVAARVGRLLLVYLGNSLASKTRFDLVDACREAVGQVRATAPDDLRLEVDLPTSAMPIVAVQGDVVAAVANLLQNAVEAIADDGSRIALRVRRTSAAEAAWARDLAPGTAASSRVYACILVDDDGPGMTEDTRRAAFDPFFTTRFTGRGLGLPVVLGVARSNDGALDIDTAPGRGTRVRLCLPLEPDADLQP